MKKGRFHYTGKLSLELGGWLQDPVIAYHLSENPAISDKPVVWICHALTANSDPTSWWPGMVGKGKTFDPAKYTIVCANILGSCYGSTGPANINPGNGKPWLKDFPLLTVRDLVRGHSLLKDHLGIETIHLLTGSSVGGFQALEWAVMESGLVKRLVLIATGPKATPWAIAINETERMAIEADPGFDGIHEAGGQKGLAAARAIGLLSYRGYEAYNLSQQETSENITDHFRASSYQRYQGEKLVKRFNAYSYYAITKTQDTHNVARGRGNMADALSQIQARTLCIGIGNDLLFPCSELKSLSGLIPKAMYTEIVSDYGHDGFLLENEQISRAIERL